MSRKNQTPTDNLSPRHILVTGASGGMGRAFALAYASQGAQLTLWGRDSKRLDAVAAQCRIKGARVTPHHVDLRDPSAALAAFEQDCKACNLDILILNAGMSDIRSSQDLIEAPEMAVQMANVNYTSPMALALCAARHMAERRCGEILLVGSVAAYFDLPFATAYSSSKAGLARFATSLHAAMRPYGVRVTLISPGFIDTAMSQRLQGWKPFLTTPETIVDHAMRALNARRSMVVFPKIFSVLSVVAALLPRWFVHRVLRKIKVEQHAYPDDRPS